ncbi:MAG: A/G-specific adenine glycosylase [Phycisphaerales bacterium]|nr:A/G-specific adenine glycosylase [Phycisphaerales bacterium]
MTPAPDDAALTRELEVWFRANARELPWRTDHRDPYRSLVSELMLQQTQVSRVIEKFEPFLGRFPTVQALAGAPEDDVLAAWSGLGYYRRARLLHACAKAIVEHHVGVVPDSLEELLELPGIGRYTAGAIASMVFGQRTPIVDGNVARVMLRVHNKPVPQTEKATIDWTWQRAEELVESCQEPAVFNEAMMELGATVCVPKGPKCLQCPISDQCGALSAGTTESIPLPKPRAKQKHLYCASVVVRDGDDIHLEQRPSAGMWAGMYQLPTLERDDRAYESSDLEAAGLADAEHIDSFTHITTHRIVEFAVYRAPAPTRTPENWSKHAVDSLDGLAISNAQVKALRIAGILES